MHNNWINNTEVKAKDSEAYAEGAGLDTNRLRDAEDIARVLKTAGHEPQEPALHHPHEAKFDDPDEAARELERINKVAA